MTEIREGSYVTHPNKPEWGTGKVYCFKGGYLLVGFDGLPVIDRLKRLKWHSGLLAAAEVSSNGILDALSPKCGGDCLPMQQKLPRSGQRTTKAAAPLVATWTLEQAYERFALHYPQGFRDSRYHQVERPWKTSQRELWDAGTASDGFRALAKHDPAAAARLVLKVVQTGKKPLLHPKGEIVLVRDALAHSGNLTRYFDALADLLEADTITSHLFESHMQALTSLPLARPGNLAKWPIVTILPFLVQPTRHIFVKPVPTKTLGRQLGKELLYSSVPKWDTYERVLAFSEWLLESLKPHGAQDMIDVQSFIYISTYEAK